MKLLNQATLEKIKKPAFRKKLTSFMKVHDNTTRRWVQKNDIVLTSWSVLEFIQLETGASSIEELLD